MSEQNACVAYYRLSFNDETDVKSTAASRWTNTDHSFWAFSISLVSQTSTITHRKRCFPPPHLGPLLSVPTNPAVTFKIPRLSWWVILALLGPHTSWIGFLKKKNLTSVQYETLLCCESMGGIRNLESVTQQLSGSFSKVRFPFFGDLGPY